MTLSPEALMSELLNDPHHIGYAGQGVAVLVALLNTSGLSDETCAAEAVGIDDILIAVDPTEWDLLTDTRRQLLVTIASVVKTFDFSLPVVQARFSQYFPANGATVTALKTLEMRPCSRYEALSGAGAVATAVDVTAAIATNGGIGP